MAAQSPFSNYWSKLTDPSRNPFRGLYQLNTFDLAIMIPYFVVLVILAAYGMHRYWLVYAYFKNRHNVPGPPPAGRPSGPRLPYSFPSTTSAT